MEQYVNNRIKKILKGDMAQNASKMLLLQILTTLIGILSSVIIARVLGPEDKGKVDLFLLLTNYIVEFGIIGVGTGFLYYQTNHKEKLELIHGTSLMFCGVMGAVIFGLGMSFHRYIVPLFTGLDKKYIILAFSIAPILLYRQISGNIIQGLNKPLFSYQITLVINMVMLFMVILLGLFGEISYSQMVLVNLAGIIIYVISAAGVIFQQNRKIKADIQLMKKVMKYGIAIYIGAFANSLLFRMDQNFLNYYWGSRFVGCYSVAVSFAEMLWSFDGIINAVTIYHIASNEEKTAKKILKKTILIQTGISCFLGTLLGILAPILIRILYGEEYLEAISGIRILIPGIVVWSIGRLISQYITLNIGKPFWCTIAAFCGVISNAILNLFLIPMYRIVGAALASTISYLLVVLIIIVFMYFFERKRKEQ